MIVIGSRNSSNSNRLVEVAKVNGCREAILVDSAQDIDWQKLKDIRALGLTAGASAPEVLVQEVIEAAKKNFDVEVEIVTLATEQVTFKIPRVLAS